MAAMIQEKSMLQLFYVIFRILIQIQRTFDSNYPMLQQKISHRSYDDG